MAKINGITKYDSVRRYLEQIYLYGFFSREDWIEIGKAKDYDKMIALVREIFPELEDDAIWRDRKKYLRFEREYTLSGTNRLLDTYMLHAMDEKGELSELLRVLSFVSEAPRSLQDISKWLETFEPAENRNMYALVRRRTQELEKYGYLKREKSDYYGRLDTLYSVQNDILKELDTEETTQLYEYLRFTAGVTYPRVAASFLQRTVERRMPEVPRGNSVLLRHYDRRSIFDEDMVYCLLSAIHKNQRVHAQLRNSERKTSFVPVAIRVDTRLGRWYVLAMEQHPVIYRISLLEHLNIGEAVEKKVWEEIRDSVLEIFKDVGFSGFNLSGPTQLVEADLNFNELPGMYMQFQREMRMGEIIEQDGEKMYRVWMHDPGELVPFLRSFAPWVKVRPGAHKLNEIIERDLEIMKKALDDGNE